ncbi:tetratricopeptide repeat protein [Streptomyces sp. NPDC003863]
MARRQGVAASLAFPHRRRPSFLIHLASVSLFGAASKSGDNYLLRRHFAATSTLYHPNTFLDRLNTARFTWELGDAVTARVLHEELLVDQREALGATHPAVMITRYNLVMLKAELGDPETALGELARLLEDRLARYGNPDHPEVITTRFGRARILARLGRTEEAAALLREVCADRARVLGEGNPATREALAELAALTEG